MRSLMLGQDLGKLARKVDTKTRLMMRAGRVTGLTGRPGFIRAASTYFMPFGERVVIIGGELVGLELDLFRCDWIWTS